MGKESEYTFAKLSGAENYKEWAREMIFALKNSGLWGYHRETGAFISKGGNYGGGFLHPSSVLRLA